MVNGYPANFRTVSGQVYAGGVPDQNFLKFFKNTLNGRTVISLDANVAKNIDAIVKSLKMNHVIIPIDSGSSVLTDSIKSLVRQIQSNLIDNSQPVYIHCLHGSDRTGLTVALYRVIKQNWSCDSAISDNVRWGYGNGISAATQTMWKNLICTKGANGVGVGSTNSTTTATTPATGATSGTSASGTDTGAALDDDIVSTMRDDFEMGNVPPAFAPQQSWAPDVGRETFNSGTERRKVLRRKILSDMVEDVNNNDIPEVGMFDNYGQMAGVGPVENSGIMQLL